MTTKQATFIREVDEDVTQLTSAIAGMSRQKREMFRAFLFDLPDTYFREAIANDQGTTDLVRALARTMFAQAVANSAGRGK